MMGLVDMKRTENILAYMERDDVYSRLVTWERSFLGTCLSMNDKRILLSKKQRSRLEVIYKRLRQCG